MNKIILIYLALFLGTISCQEINERPSCSIVKTGTFKYLDAQDTTAYITIDSSKHIEHISNGKYILASKIVWLSDCKYRVYLFSNTVPDLDYMRGDSLTVTINKTDGNLIYYTSEINGQRWQARMLKIK